MADSKTTALTEATSVALTDLAYVVTTPGGTPASKKATINTLSKAILAGGWIDAGESWTYASADGPTGVITVPSGAASKYSAGMRIMLTQTTVKYFIITVVADTTLTVYGGTDYTLANAAISVNYYSTSKAPLGFPLDPTKWTVIVTDTTARSQATPTANTWYNPNSTTISIPIGVWDVSYQVGIYSYRAAISAVDVKVTLSTANNSQSDAELTANVRAATLPSASAAGALVHRSKTLVLAAKTSYYLNILVEEASMAELMFSNTYGTMVIRARCAYL